MVPPSGTTYDEVDLPKVSHQRASLIPMLIFYHTRVSLFDDDESEPNHHRVFTYDDDESEPNHHRVFTYDENHCTVVTEPQLTTVTEPQMKRCM